jgi:hypothetical protein
MKSQILPNRLPKTDSLKNANFKTYEKDQNLGDLKIVQLILVVEVFIRVTNPKKEVDSREKEKSVLEEGNWTMKFYFLKLKQEEMNAKSCPKTRCLGK